MKLIQITILILCFVSCTDKTNKQNKENEVLTRHLPQTELNHISKNQSVLPADDKLNEKHFYKIESFPNLVIKHSKLYCVTRQNGFTNIGGGFRIYFKPTRIIFFCDSLITQLKRNNQESDKESRILYYKHLRSGAIRSFKQSVEFDEIYLSDLLPSCEAYFWDTKSKTRPIALLIKTYRTMCVDKRNDYDLITSKGDTVRLINNLEMCIN